MIDLHSMEALIQWADCRKTFFDPYDFPWVPIIEKNWMTIRKEAESKLQCLDGIPNFQDIQVEQSNLTVDDRWKTYILYAYGHRSERNCSECPETARLVESIPGMTTAMYSILDGPKQIPEHRGPYNGVLRYHLGIKVPDGCGLQVGQDVRFWEEGKSIIFDDTHPHSAWNCTNDIRVVLFVDFIRPLPQFLQQLNTEFVGEIARSAFISEAVNRLERWNGETIQ